MPLTLRRLAARDAAAARTLANAVLADGPYARTMLASLNEALTSPSGEYRAIGAHDANTLSGVIVFGETAGAIGAGRIYCVAVDAAFRRRRIATALTDAACADLRGAGARFAMIELPEAPELTRALALARQTGFHEQGRVSDYVSDGVALLLLRRELAPP